jgi:hypothetical protein
VLPALIISLLLAGVEAAVVTMVLAVVVLEVFVPELDCLSQPVLITPLL